jgi:hypothetical protein
MMSRFGTFLLLTLVGLFLFSGTEVQAASKAPEIGTQGQSAAAQAQAMIDLHKRLSASPRATVRHSVVLTTDEADILTRPGVDSTGRFRVGVHRAVGKPVSNNGADLVVRIPGASAVRLELTKVKGTVAVFNDAGEAHEYTEDGFTHTFSGDEVRVRGSAHVSGAGAVNMGGNLCDFNASCTENASCVTIPPNIDTVRNAYASILYRSGPWYYLCSGGLLADSKIGEIPYFLTANHCVNEDSEARSVETFFQYTQSCGINNDCTLPRPGDTVGSTIKATDSSGDFTLLELAEDPPLNSVFLGWNNSPIAYTDEAPLFRISHPGGAPQAYSEHEVDAYSFFCTVWPRGEWIYSKDIFGATEGGSSGSPVLNDQGQVVGQLSGACGIYPDIVCDFVNNRTVDGAFAYYYPKVQPFLGDGSTGSGCSTDSDCDDGVNCTDDSCDVVNGTCLNAANDAHCPDDGLFCTGVEYCDTVTDCNSTGNPCSAEEICNEETNSCDTPTTTSSTTTSSTTSTTTTTTTSTTTTTQPPATTCADITDKGTCNEDPNCEWDGHPRNGTCQDAGGSTEPPLTCSDYDGDQSACADAGCRWHKIKMTCN